MTYRNDWKKLLIAEIKAGKQLQATTWTQGGGWSTSYDSAAATEILCSVQDGDDLYAGADNGDIYVRKGTVWSLSGNIGIYPVYSLHVFKGKIYAGTGYMSMPGALPIIFAYDKVNPWTPVFTLPDINSSGAVMAFCNTATTIYAALYDGNFSTGLYINIISSTDGLAWNVFLHSNALLRPQALLADGVNIFMAGKNMGPHGLIIMYNGSTWSTVHDSGADSGCFYALCKWNGKYYAGRNAGKILESSTGATWTEVVTIGVGTIYAFLSYGSILLAAYTDKIFQSVDGSVWTLFYDSAETTIYTLIIHENGLYAGTGSAGKILVYTSPFVWQCDFAYGEAVDVQVDGVALAKETTYADCDALEGSFFHDFFAGILYVHLAAGASPGAYVSPDYTYNVVAFFWKCFANRQETGANAVVFIPTGCTYPAFYDPTLKADSLSQLTATVADHFESAMETSSGGISITNAEGWWYAAIDDFYWNNKDVRVKIGEVGDLYAALETIFIGKVRTPSVSDDAVTFEMVDSREGRLQSIPTTHYDLTRFANLDPDTVGVPIPILFGEKKNITPVKVDTAAFTFKISETHFGSTVFELESIDAVYFKGIALSETTHYVEDLHNGEFSLTFDPADGLVTCDAKGIQDGFDMATGLATGVYSEAVCNHLFFVLHILNEIPITDINLNSFFDLSFARTQAVAWLLDTDTPTIDFNRLLQQTSIYHFLPLNDGTFAAKYYRRTVPAGTLELRNYDHASFKKTRPSDGVFRDITLKYGKDPTTGIWLTVQNSEDTVEQNHNTKDPYIVETALRDAGEAAQVLAFYVSLLKEPPTKIETSMSLIGAAILPTDKLYVNRDISADGKAVTISTDEVYVILQTRKDFNGARVGVTAQLDTQLSIFAVYADSAHQDVAHVDHSDSLHDDSAHANHTDNVAHGDDAYEDHSDNRHVDTPAYADAAYDDHTDHDDVLYSDDYTDQPYIDIPYSDSSYVDHDDVAYVDAPYSDHPHQDSAHEDHDDILHTDGHTDISHIDSWL